MSPPPVQPETILVTLTGKDRPGVTSSIFATLATAGIEVVDIEQIVLRRRLILGVLVTVPDDWQALRTAIEKTAADLEMTVEIDRGSGDTTTRPGGRSHVTLIGSPLQASAMAAVAARIAEAGANIDRIERMARYPVTAIDLHVSGADTERLRPALAVEAAAQGIDIAVQPADLLRRSMRLIVMDVDSTLVHGEVIEMLAAHAGFAGEVAAVTEAAMRGELDFEESLRSRVRLLAGLPASALDEVYDAIELNPGARTLVRTLRRLGYRFALVSGGFSQITDRLAADLGIHYSRANQLEVVDGVLTGNIVGEVVDRAGKARALREFAAEMGLSEAATIAIGDGANDLDMLNAAGLGIAYNARPVVQQAADTSVNVPYLDTIVYLLGITREEIVAADAAEGIVTPLTPRLIAETSRLRRLAGCSCDVSRGAVADVSRGQARPTWNATTLAEASSRSAQSPSYVITAAAQVGKPRVIWVLASSSPSPSSSSCARKATVGLWPMTTRLSTPSSVRRTRSSAVSGPAS